MHQTLTITIMIRNNNETFCYERTRATKFERLCLGVEEWLALPALTTPPVSVFALVIQTMTCSPRA